MFTRVLLGVLASTFWWSSIGLAQASGSLQLNLVPQTEFFTYDNASNTAEVDVTGVTPNSVNWYLDPSSQLPPALSMGTDANGNLLIGGDGYFSGSWCFNVTATAAGGLQGENQICVVGQANANVPSLRFTGIRQLPDAVVGGNWQAAIPIDPSSIDQTQPYLLQLNYALPAGLTSTFVQNQFELVLQGVAQQPGTYFIVAHAEQNGSYIEQQFALNVVSAPPPVPSCAPGYYYDPNLNYCVQDAGPTCGDGTYYDPSTNSCVGYAPGPIFCPPDEHYDPNLNACVYDQYPVCPGDMHWDPYDQRCEWNYRPAPPPPGPRPPYPHPPGPRPAPPPGPRPAPPPGPRPAPPPGPRPAPPPRPPGKHAVPISEQ